MFEGTGEDIVKEVNFRGNGKSIDYVRTIATGADGARTSAVNLASQISQADLQALTSLFKN